MTKLLEIRNKMKKKKPEFIRQDYHKKKKLARNWRRPRGYHAKMRLHKRGQRVSVETGYRSPRAVRGLTSEGLVPVLVQSLDLDNIKKNEIIIISSAMGTKKRVELIKKAIAKGIKIKNIKNPEQYVKAIEDKFKAKKEHKKQKEKEAKEKLAKKEEKKVDDLANKVTEEEKKEIEKKEKDKLLTKRDVK